MAPSDHVPIINGCRFCLMCRHVCPMGRLTKREANTPHGWALLIASVDRGQLPWNDETVGTLYECANCGLCHANCVTDRPLPAAIMAARGAIVERGLAPAHLSGIREQLDRWGNPYRDAAPEAATGRAADALFVGAAAWHLRPETVAAARRLLDALGIAHTPIGVGRSSPYLPYTLGLWDTARALAQATLEEAASAGCRRVIVLTPEDVHAFGAVMAELGLEWPAGAQVVELTTVLAERVEALHLRRADDILTYHDPSQSPRFPRRAAAARGLLSTLSAQPLREMFWREERAAADGSVGGLAFTHPELAARLSRERLAEAEATGADVLVTEDPAALHHLSTHLDGRQIRVQGLFELAAQQLA